MSIPGDYIVLPESRLVTKEDMVPDIPPITHVADQQQGPVPQVPDQVDAADLVGPSVPHTYGAHKAKRQPVDHQSHRLNWRFIRLMGKIAHYAADKYGSVEQYTDSRLEGEKSPINHIVGHIEQYCARVPHDKFDNLEMQLAAIAYNAMMEFWYLTHGGPTVPEDLYK